MDPTRPSRRMRLPIPARAATAAGILLATSVLLLAGDLTVVQMAGDEAHAVPFYVQTENFTVAGMRITNAGGGDLIQAYEMFGYAACGYTYRSPSLVPYVPGNNSTRLFFQDSNGTAWTYGNVTDPFVRTAVAGNVTFYVVESVNTPALLRGEDAATYRASHREAAPPEIHIVDINGTEDGTDSDAQEDSVVVRRAVTIRVSVGCQTNGQITIERGPHPGVNVRYAFSSSEPWLDDLPVHQGVDFLYVLRADEQPDNETYAALAESLRSGSEFWIYSMQHATVFDDEAIVPDRILRVGIVVTLVGALAFLALALRRSDRPLPPGPTDAAFALAAAGESHLLRLRRTWGLVGALLVPMLAAATYLLFNLDYAPPSTDWYDGIGIAVLVLDAAVLALWGLALLRAHKDLTAWRAAWTRMEAVDLDAL